MKSYLCGLVHDIGKPGTRMESSVHYSFKGHGIVGGALIEMYVSPQLIENFTPYGLTKDDFGDISLCCDSHMCGYFAKCGKEYDCKFHHACFRMMPPSAKRVLCTLRVGDQVFIFRHVVFIHTLIHTYIHTCIHILVRKYVHAYARTT